MNETQKQIIEIIEPYMVKILDEWCIFTYKSKMLKLNSNNLKNDIISLKEDLERWLAKVIWHYDITPIEKYIVNNGWINLKFVKWNTDYKEVWVNWKTYIFPFKDPSLYTEQENKDLLELLKKLWNHYGLDQEIIEK